MVKYYELFGEIDVTDTKVNHFKALLLNDVCITYHTLFEHWGCKLYKNTVLPKAINVDDWKNDNIKYPSIYVKYS